MRANPHFRDGRSLDKAVADMALLPLASPLASPCEAIEEIEKVPWSGSSPKARNHEMLGWRG